MPFSRKLQFGPWNEIFIFLTVSQHNNRVTEWSITIHRLTEWRLWLPTWDEARITEQWKVMATNRVSERQLVSERRRQIHYSNWCHAVCRSRCAVGRPASGHIRVQECCALSRCTHWRARVIRRRWVRRWPDGRQLPTVRWTYFLCPRKKVYTTSHTTFNNLLHQSHCLY